MKFARTIAAIVGFAFLPSIAQAQALDTCTKQSACIQFEVTQIDPATQCTTGCEFRICAILDFSGASCSKLPGGTVSHTCVKPYPVCDPAPFDVSAQQVTDLPQGFQQCQIVSAEGTAEFLFKDGTICGDSAVTSTSGDAVVPATCEPSTTQTCSGPTNIGKECIWTIVAPACPGATVTPTPTPTLTPTPTPTVTSTPACAALPVAGCRTPAAGAKALLMLKQKSAGTKDQLQWKWLKGSVTAKADFGTPLTATDYQLCIYDGTATVIMDAAIPAGGLCGATKPAACWKENAKGFAYKDKDRTPDGIDQLKLKEGLVTGKSQIQVKGKGSLLDDPLFPLNQPVTVQLLNSDGICWEAVYSTAIKNTAVPLPQFKAKAD